MKMMENTNSGENAEQWSHVADGQISTIASENFGIFLLKLNKCLYYD